MEKDEEDQYVKYMPWTGGFWKFHFGTDMLMASWLFIISSLFGTGYIIDVMVTETGVHELYVRLAHWAVFATSVLFLMGCVCFLYVSYPSEMNKMMQDLERIARDPDSLTWTERYFTGTDMIIAVWFFYWAVLPFMVFGIYMIVAYPSSYVGYMYLGACVFYFVVMSVWVIGALPLNMIQNDMQGTSYFYDYVFKPALDNGCGWCCCCLFCCGVQCGDSESFDKVLKPHMGSDLLAGMYIFLLLAIFTAIYGILQIFTDFTSLLAWLVFGSGTAFALGMALATYAMYPENMNSAIGWEILTTCSIQERHLGGDDAEAGSSTSPTATSPLIPPDSTTNPEADQAA